MDAAFKSVQNLQSSILEAEEHALTVGSHEMAANSYICHKLRRSYELQVNRCSNVTSVEGCLIKICLCHQSALL